VRFLTAVTVLVTPGPAVTTATPVTPVILEAASAAKTAVASLRTSSTCIAARLHATRIGEMWPPHRQNTAFTPWAVSTFATMSPPCISIVIPYLPVLAARGQRFGANAPASNASSWSADMRRFSSTSVFKFLPLANPSLTKAATLS
jgi:hypothetical protein